MLMRETVWRRVCDLIDRALEESELTDQVNVAVDGMCGAGKSTLGRFLTERYDCNLFHMDDFFLRPGQRTPERYAEPGGNVDYERFAEEILAHLPDEEGLTYRPFDCAAMALSAPRRVPRRRLNIVEGVYSCHPYFGEIYRLRLFAEVSEAVQRKRLLARGGPEKYRRFIEEWIPMESRYFEAYGVREKCIRISMG